MAILVLVLTLQFLLEAPILFRVIAAQPLVAADVQLTSLAVTACALASTTLLALPTACLSVKIAHQTAVTPLFVAMARQPPQMRDLAALWVAIVAAEVFLFDFSVVRPQPVCNCCLEPQHGQPSATGNKKQALWRLIISKF
jgi:hypothetical protein